MNDPRVSRNPWLFVPSLYFAEGLPYVLINTVSVILYKKMGVDNAAIAFWTSWLYLPWVIKMFWGPLVDLRSTKRTWILSTQLTMALALFFVAFSLSTAGFFYLSLIAFVLAAFVSATYDIATDGFYMLALTEQDQAFFVGLRSGFYRLAMIFGSGLLVYVAGMIEVRTGNIPQSWTMVLTTGGGIFLLLAAYHFFVLPYPDSDKRRETRGETASFKEVFTAYFKQEKIGVLVAFILLYRLGEAMLLKLVSPFLLDGRTAGGMGLTTSEVGLVYGTVGIIALVFGGILGGWLISRYGLARCTWPLVIAMHLPDLFFVYMAWAQPQVWMTYPLVALEQFGYGMGFTVFTVYLMYSAEGKYKTSHYAISTGIMALGMMLPGLLAGWLQQKIGYTAFFLAVSALTIPGMLTIPFLPVKSKKRD
ncbi:MAG: AmpG family muropeptide MFS transporter [Nitrospirota bacterium]|nr:AmpG family muropeptide MFS transporter [Nitrospirota bacterium]